LITLMLVCFAATVFASDVMIQKEVKNITFKKDKNGSEYARIIITDAKTLNGVTYQKDVPVMVFGDKVAQAKTLKKGSTFKAIVSTGEYRGNTSYAVIDFVK
jgi:hypothetical protein